MTASDDRGLRERDANAEASSVPPSRPARPKRRAAPIPATAGGRTSGSSIEREQRRRGRGTRARGEEVGGRRPDEQDEDVRDRARLQRHESASRATSLAELRDELARRRRAGRARRAGARGTRARAPPRRRGRRRTRASREPEPRLRERCLPVRRRARARRTSLRRLLVRRRRARTAIGYSTFACASLGSSIASTSSAGRLHVGHVDEPRVRLARGRPCSTHALHVVLLADDVVEHVEHARGSRAPCACSRRSARPRRRPRA